MWWRIIIVYIGCIQGPTIKVTLWLINHVLVKIYNKHSSLWIHKNKFKCLNVFGSICFFLSYLICLDSDSDNVRSLICLTVISQWTIKKGRYIDSFEWHTFKVVPVTSMMSNLQTWQNKIQALSIGLDTNIGQMDSIKVQGWADLNAWKASLNIKQMSSFDLEILFNLS